MKTTPYKNLAEQVREWMNVHYNEYRNDNAEVNMTALGEAAAAEFGFLSDEGDTYIEQEIFDIASEYFEK